LGQIHVSIQYTPKEDLDENTHDLDRAYFPVREGCKLVMYQDADTPQLPVFDGVTEPDGSQYQTTRCWKDLYDHIKNAQKFIYIAGWSVNTNISLVRGEDDPDGFSNVGELLKLKAEEGVRVLVMPWNEKLSTDVLPGFMGTHDEETRQYFEDTMVDCVLVGRQKTDGVLASQFVSGMYTHHQKTVICDATFEEDESLRRIVAYVGGLDIAGGRYDSPEFPLFRTLRTLHEGDYLSNMSNVGGDPNVGPREPWHDIHARVEGPIALDIKKNFEERWCRAGGDMVSRLAQMSEEEFLFDAPAIHKEQEGGPWNLQMFRSITSDSCTFFDIERHQWLHRKGGRLVENTINNCMVQQVRNAKRFIYMENQYFLGSAYAWSADRETLCNHIIPLEITKKICEKIVAGEPFKAYIVIPMFPEGDPSSKATQEILFWQFRTMETMYRRIAQTIKEGEVGTQPTDYLSFFCLAKRESMDEVPVDDLEEPAAGTDAEKIRQSLRHPIYVHCKMSIFDDEYILIGSANINQRSLGGNRDTEIAVGGYQPDHNETDSPRGDVHSFRMALWAAHLGGTNEDYLQPETDECRAKVKETTEDFWSLYTADEPEHSDAHMLPYPINVDEDGMVTALESPWDCFPDTLAPVLGAKSGVFPKKLTT